MPVMGMVGWNRDPEAREAGTLVVVNGVRRNLRMELDQ